MFTEKKWVRGPKRAFFNVWITSILLFAAAVFIIPGFIGTAFSIVTLSWNAPTTNNDGTPLTNLAGFKVYYGTSSGQYSNSIDVHNVTTYALNNLTPGTYYFVATAYNASGIESSYSNEVVKNETGVDTTAPTITVFTTPATSTSLVVSGISLAATDNVGVTGYMITESATAPSATASGWSTVSPTTYSASVAGTHTLYAYAKDAAGNVSAGRSANVTITLPDTTAPVVTGFAVLATSSSLTIPVTLFTATDNTAVTGYIITESAAAPAVTASGWSAAAPANYMVATSGAHTLYAYAKDAADNVSTGRSVSVTVNIPSTVTVNLSPVSDTFLNLDSNNNSTSQTLNTYTWPNDKVANSILMKFDLSAIPAGAVIQSATLYMYLTEADTATAYATYNLSLNRIINHSPDLTKTTGYTYDGTNSWTPNTNCYNNIPLAQADISSAYDIESIDKAIGFKGWNATQLVADWIASPASNYGLMINSDGTAPADTYRTFASSKNATVSYHPYLTVVYSTGNSTDTNPPAVTVFTVPSSVTSLTVPITGFSASDNVGVTGYMVTESATAPVSTATGWSATAPTTYHVMTPGSHTLYAWAKDAAGNVSAGVSASISITIPGATIVWSNPTTGNIGTWSMSGVNFLSSTIVGTAAAPWAVVGMGDFNKDGKSDILLRNTTTGDVDVWFMNGTTVTGGAYVGTAPAPWTVVGAGDFNKDGNIDILLVNTATGDVDVWFMNGTTVTGGAYVGTAPAPWTVVGTGDFNNDGNADILLRNTTTGDIDVWFMNGTTVTGGAYVGTAPAPWTVVGTGDFNNDGNADILLRNTTTGEVDAWFMNGATVTGGAAISHAAGLNWTIVGIQ